ncbi:MAG: hypothetical protein F6K11_03405 [Leptolyngbya sp. SIO3F4]|nr:hypothetical protein [Leptolyngbya sp. SIO3F4]
MLAASVQAQEATTLDTVDIRSVYPASSFETYSRLLEENPYQLEGWLQRSEARAARGDTIGYFNDLRRLIAYFPDRPEGYTYLGRAYMVIHRYRHGIKHFNMALQKDPDFAMAYYERGKAWEALGSNHHACTDWSHAIDLGYEPAFDRIAEVCAKASLY